MDSHHDSWLLHSNVLRASLYYSHCHWYPDRFLQRSHRYRQRAEQGKEFTIHKVAELVFFGNDDVLSLR